MRPGRPTAPLSIKIIHLRESLGGFQHGIASIGEIPSAQNFGFSHRYPNSEGTLVPQSHVIPNVLGSLQRLPTQSVLPPLKTSNRCQHSAGQNLSGGVVKPCFPSTSTDRPVSVRGKRTWLSVTGEGILCRRVLEDPDACPYQVLQLEFPRHVTFCSWAFASGLLRTLRTMAVDKCLQAIWAQTF
jgi:hypothetical protein